MSRTLYPECNEYEAWENSKTLTYQGCTEKIAQSNTQIEEKMETIELFAANNINSTIVLQIQMGKTKSASKRASEQTGERQIGQANKQKNEPVSEQLYKRTSEQIY